MITTIGKFTVEAVDINATDCPLKVTWQARVVASGVYADVTHKRVYGVESDAWQLVGYVLDRVSNERYEADLRDPEKILAMIVDNYPTEINHL